MTPNGPQNTGPKSAQSGPATGEACEEREVDKTSGKIIGTGDWEFFGGRNIRIQVHNPVFGVASAVNISYASHGVTKSGHVIPNSWPQPAALRPSTRRIDVLAGPVPLSYRRTTNISSPSGKYYWTVNTEENPSVRANNNKGRVSAEPIIKVFTSDC